MTPGYSRSEISDSVNPVQTGPEWVDTPSADKALAALGYAQMAGCIVVMHGESGTGKTIACERYAQRVQDVWLATMSPASAKLYPCLDRVADACGLRLGPGGPAVLGKRIARHLRGSCGLLVVDEAHCLSAGALEGLRYLHDATGVGLALVGAERLYERLARGSWGGRFAQLYSRIGRRVRLGAPTPEDVDALLAGWGVDDDAVRQEARQVAALPGGLWVLSHALRLGSLYAAGGAVGAEHLKAARKECIEALLGGAE